MHSKLFNASHASLVLYDTQLHRNMTIHISRLCFLNDTKGLYLNKTLRAFMEENSSMILTFAFSSLSILIKARSYNLS